MQKVTGLNGLTPIGDAMAEMNAQALMAYLWVHLREEDADVQFHQMNDVRIGQMTSARPLQIDDATDLGADDPPEVLELLLGERLRDLDAGAVDDEIDPAEARDNLANRLVGGGRVRHVGAEVFDSSR